MSEVIRILDALQQGDPKAAEVLLPLVYNELPKLAMSKITQEVPGQTLQPTTLVHEAWVRLGGSEAPRKFSEVFGEGNGGGIAQG